MAIRTWHVGKLVLLWIWGLVLVGVALSLLEAEVSWLIGYVLIAGIVVVPAGLSVLSWRWLGGREGRFAIRRQGKSSGENDGQ